MSLKLTENDNALDNFYGVGNSVDPGNGDVLHVGWVYSPAAPLRGRFVTHQTHSGSKSDLALYAISR